MTLREWVESNGIAISRLELTVGQEQGVVDPALAAVLPGYMQNQVALAGGGIELGISNSTAGKMDLVRLFAQTAMPAEFFGTPVPPAAVVAAGNEWGYVGAVRGDDPGLPKEFQIAGIGEGVPSTLSEAIDLGLVAPSARSFVPRGERVSGFGDGPMGGGFANGGGTNRMRMPLLIVAAVVLGLWYTSRTAP